MTVKRQNYGRALPDEHLDDLRAEYVEHHPHPEMGRLTQFYCEMDCQTESHADEGGDPR